VLSLLTILGGNVNEKLLVAFVNRIKTLDQSLQSYRKEGRFVISMRVSQQKSAAWM
jgi:hypothetical protein